MNELGYATRKTETPICLLIYFLNKAIYKAINMISKFDNAIALQKYAIDCINNGMLFDAKEAIKSSIDLIPRTNNCAIYTLLISMIEGDL